MLAVLVRSTPATVLVGTVTAKVNVTVPAGAIVDPAGQVKVTMPPTTAHVPPLEIAETIAHEENWAGSTSLTTVLLAGARPLLVMSIR